jgi:hypothetical protein
MENSDNTYVYLWRSIEDAPFYSDNNCLKMAIHLLLNANYKDRTTLFNGVMIEVKRGQIITGVHALAEKTHMSVQSVRTSIRLLKTCGFLTIQPTSRYSLITIVNYAKYQDPTNKRINNPANKQTTSCQQTDNKLPTTSEERVVRVVREERESTARVSAVPEQKQKPEHSYSPTHPYPQPTTEWDLPPVPPPPSQTQLRFNPRGPVPVLLANEFEQAWAKYPNHMQKERALREWGAQQPKLADVLKALAWQVTTEEFQGSACPIFAYYLKDKRWQDELPPAIVEEQERLEAMRMARLKIFVNSVCSDGLEHCKLFKQAYAEFKDHPLTTKAQQIWEQKQAKGVAQ